MKHLVYAVKLKTSTQRFTEALPYKGRLDITEMFNLSNQYYMHRIEFCITLGKYNIKIVIPQQARLAYNFKDIKLKLLKTVAWL